MDMEHDAGFSLGETGMDQQHVPEQGLPVQANRRRLLMLLGGAALPFAGLRSAHAQLPRQPVRIVVPFTAGGASDVVARAMGAELQTRIGQPVIVENRPGASGLIALENVRSSRPDGSSMMLVSGSSMLASAFQGKTFDVEANLTPLAMLYTQKLVLLTSTEDARTASMRSAADIVRFAKAQPGVLTFASSSPGTMGHLVMERFKSNAGLQMTHVPYKGSPQAVLDLLAGRVDFFLADSTSTMQHVREGKLRPLAVSGAERIASLPEVPTFQEQGFADLLPGIWAGLSGPPGMPAGVVEAMGAQIKAAFDTPAFQQRLVASGNEPWFLPSGQMLAYVKENTRTWGDFIRGNKITID